MRNTQMLAGNPLPASLRTLASRRAMRVALPLAALLLASGCSSPTGGHTVTVTASSVSGLGTVLVNSSGHPLYMYVPDHHRAVTCTAADNCDSDWPPLMLPPGDTLAAGPGVKSSLLASDPDPAGGRVVTYDGWPLYTFANDDLSGVATGQGLDDDGGLWYVLRPSGAPLTSG